MTSPPEVLDNCIYIFKNLLTEQECDEIIQHFDSIQSKQATVVDYNFTNNKGNTSHTDRQDHSYRKGSVKFSKDIPNVEKALMAMEFVASDTGIVLTQDMVDFQLGIYDNVGDYFNWHPDHKVQAATFYQQVRKLSASLQLTDPAEYQGCELQVRTEEVSGRSYTCSKKKGDFIVFPSWLSHRVTKLESGHRDSLVLWYKGPESR